jgi:hypothetical protein
MCEIIILIFGIITLIRGHFLLTRVKEVRGWPARIIGVLLILPFPLSFLVGLVLGATFVAMRKDIGEARLEPAIRFIELGIVALCFFSAIGVALFFAQPVRKKKAKPADVAVPEDYDERFQDTARASSASQDIMKGSSRPAIPPDDRIQP